jgi:hypothetical protein
MPQLSVARVESTGSSQGGGGLGQTDDGGVGCALGEHHVGDDHRRLDESQRGLELGKPLDVHRLVAVVAELEGQVARQVQVVLESQDGGRVLAVAGARCDISTVG